jgi:hypothetical protein
MRSLLLKLICLLLLPLLGLLLYAAWWGVAYRLPRSADKTIDLRSAVDRQFSKPAQLIFCAGLANNPHGFPGHAYVIWRGERTGETLGFCPAGFWSIVPSLWQPVSGVVNDAAATADERNLEKLTVLVDRETYDRTLRLGRSWDAREFRTGSRDCCAFVDFIARDAGLAVPEQKYLYPHDHIRLLKDLNQSAQILNSERLVNVPMRSLR